MKQRESISYNILNADPLLCLTYSKRPDCRLINQQGPESTEELAKAWTLLRCSSIPLRTNEGRLVALY